MSSQLLFSLENECILKFCMEVNGIIKHLVLFIVLFHFWVIIYIFFRYLKQVHQLGNNYESVITNKEPPQLQKLQGKLIKVFYCCLFEMLLVPIPLGRIGSKWYKLGFIYHDMENWHFFFLKLTLYYWLKFLSEQVISLKILPYKLGFIYHLKNLHFFF